MKQKGPGLNRGVEDIMPWLIKKAGKEGDEEF